MIFFPSVGLQSRVEDFRCTGEGLRPSHSDSLRLNEPSGDAAESPTRVLSEGEIGILGRIRVGEDGNVIGLVNCAI